MTEQQDEDHQTFKQLDFVDDFIDGMKAAQYVAIDTESNGKDIRSGEGYTIGLSAAFRENTTGPITCAYFPMRHYDWNYDTNIWAKLREAVQGLEAIIFHNAKHDLEALKSLDIYYNNAFYDTMLMAHLINENFFSKGLDWLSKELLDDRKDRSQFMDRFVKTFGWGMAPSWMIQEYAEHDAYLTLLLFEKFHATFSEEITLDEWAFRQRFVRLLAKMEHRGILIDQELSKQEAAIGEARMSLLADELGYNPSSRDDLEELLIGKMGLPIHGVTPGGKASFDKAAMEKYERDLEKRDDPTARKVLEYRGWQKTVSSNYRAYLKLAGPDGRVRANYKLHGTVTGRLSCSDPNLQQIPRVSDKRWNGKLKEAFISQDGFTLYEADYAQLELRLAAAYAKDTGLLKAFEEGRDVFTEMAETLGMARHDAKTLAYTIQYGGGLKRISDVFNVDVSEAKAIRQNFFDRYPNIRAVSQRASLLAQKRGYVSLWTGRRRHFANPREEGHKAFNAVIQGGAADIVMRSMLRLEDTVDGEYCRMLLQVHDSVVCEIENSRASNYLPMIKEVMEDVQPDFGVRFAVNIHVWGSNEDIL